MQIIMNGVTADVNEPATVASAVAAHTGRALDPDGAPTDGRPLAVAAALDGQIVPRTDWSRTPVTQGARVDIVTAVQGG